MATKDKAIRSFWLCATTGVCQFISNMCEHVFAHETSSALQIISISVALASHSITSPRPRDSRPPSLTRTLSLSLSLSLSTYLHVWRRISSILMSHFRPTHPQIFIHIANELRSPVVFSSLPTYSIYRFVHTYEPAKIPRVYGLYILEDIRAPSLYFSLSRVFEYK
jgi:hypothetical protein